MKTVKRIIAVLLLTIVVVLVGYLSFTGSRLHDKKEQTETEVICYVQEDYKY